MVKNFSFNLKLLKPVIPAAVITAVVVLALSGYEPPVYEAKVTEPVSSSEKAFEIPSITLPETTTLPEEARTDASPASGAISSLKEIDDSNAIYQDGVYEGSAQGFGGNITVRVTIENGKIADIVIVSAADETPEYFNRAKTVIDSILNGQTTNVDVVSGATYSSNGIIQAVRNALSKASLSETPVSDDAATAISSENIVPPEKSDVKKLPVVVENNTVYTDGTYMGVGNGYGGTISVKVTVKNHQIEKIELLDHFGETPSYFRKASALADTIIATQSTNVDTISGATLSSNGIISAVRDALEKSVKGSAGVDSGQSGSNTESDEQSKPSIVSEDRTDGNNDSSDKDDEKLNDQTEDREEKSIIYEDGIYEGEGYVDRWEYYLTLSVTVKNDKVTSIDNLMLDLDEEDDYYLDNDYYTNMIAAKKIIPQIISAGLPEGIDTRCGATLSANAIIEAVNDSLKQAKEAKQ